MKICVSNQTIIKDHGFDSVIHNPSQEKLNLELNVIIKIMTFCSVITQLFRASHIIGSLDQFEI